MDPIAAIALINDDDYDLLSREVALEGLAEWTAKGGAIPQDAPLICSKDFPDWLFNTCAAINCAMVNADLSGLEGLGYPVLG